MKNLKFAIFPFKTDIPQAVAFLVFLAELHAHAARAKRSTMGKKNFGNHVTVLPTDRPSAPQVYQCKIAQLTSIATKMQLEVILAGNRIASLVL